MIVNDFSLDGEDLSINQVEEDFERAFQSRPIDSVNRQDATNGDPTPNRTTSRDAIVEKVGFADSEPRAPDFYDLARLMVIASQNSTEEEIKDMAEKFGKTYEGVNGSRDDVISNAIEEIFVEEKKDPEIIKRIRDLQQERLTNLGNAINEQARDLVISKNRTAIKKFITGDDYQKIDYIVSSIWKEEINSKNVLITVQDKNIEAVYDASLNYKRDTKIDVKLPRNQQRQLLRKSNEIAGNIKKIEDVKKRRLNHGDFELSRAELSKLYLNNGDDRAMKNIFEEFGHNIARRADIVRGMWLSCQNGQKARQSLPLPNISNAGGAGASTGAGAGTASTGAGAGTASTGAAADDDGGGAVYWGRPIIKPFYNLPNDRRAIADGGQPVSEIRPGEGIAEQVTLRDKDIYELSQEFVDASHISTKQQIANMANEFAQTYKGMNGSGTEVIRNAIEEIFVEEIGQKKPQNLELLQRLRNERSTKLYKEIRTGERNKITSQYNELITIEIKKHFTADEYSKVEQIVRSILDEELKWTIVTMDVNYKNIEAVYDARLQYLMTKTNRELDELRKRMNIPEKQYSYNLDATVTAIRDNINEIDIVKNQRLHSSFPIYRAKLSSLYSVHINKDNVKNIIDDFGRNIARRADIVRGMWLSMKNEQELFRNRLTTAGPDTDAAWILNGPIGTGTGTGTAAGTAAGTGTGTGNGNGNGTSITDRIEDLEDKLRPMYVTLLRMQTGEMPYDDNIKAKTLKQIENTRKSIVALRSRYEKKIQQDRSAYITEHLKAQRKIKLLDRKQRVLRNRYIQQKNPDDLNKLDESMKKIDQKIKEVKARDEQMEDDKRKLPMMSIDAIPTKPLPATDSNNPSFENKNLRKETYPGGTPAVFATKSFKQDDHILMVHGRVLPPNTSPTNGLIVRRFDHYIIDIKGSSTENDFLLSMEYCVVNTSDGTTACYPPSSSSDKERLKANCGLVEYIGYDPDTKNSHTINIDVVALRDIENGERMIIELYSDDEVHVRYKYILRKPFVEARQCGYHQGANIHIPNTRRRSSKPNRQDVILHIVQELQRKNEEVQEAIEQKLATDPSADVTDTRQQIKKITIDAILQHDEVFSATLTHPLLDKEQYTASKQWMDEEKEKNADEFKQAMKNMINDNRKLLSATISQMRKNFILCSTGESKRREYSSGYQPYVYNEKTHRHINAVNLQMERDVARFSKKGRYDSKYPPHLDFGTRSQKWKRWLRDREAEKYGDIPEEAKSSDDEPVRGKSDSGYIESDASLVVPDVIRTRHRVATDNIRSDTSLVVPDVVVSGTTDDRRRRHLRPGVPVIASETSLVVPNIVRKQPYSGRRRLLLWQRETHGSDVYGRRRGDNDDDIQPVGSATSTTGDSKRAKSNLRRHAGLPTSQSDNIIRHARGTGLLLLF